MTSRARIIISGHVQGVFFRSFIRSQAKLYQVNGWTKNMESGQVEAVFEGDRDQVQELIDSCKEGPPGARVGDVDVKWEDFSGSFTSFEIR